MPHLTSSDFAFSVAAASFRSCDYWEDDHWINHKDSGKRWQALELTNSGLAFSVAIVSFRSCGVHARMKSADLQSCLALQLTSTRAAAQT